MAKLDISNVIRVTLMSALMGLADINTSALALFTSEVPIPSGYTQGVYLSPQGVATDFGSNSATYRLANQVFAQNPNILTGGGYLVIIPREAAAAAQAATIISRVPVDLTKLSATDYKISIKVDAGSDADLAIGAIDSTTLASAVASLNSTAVAAAGATFSATGSVASAILTLKSNTTGATSALVIATTATGTDIATLIGMDSASATGAATGLERVKDAILRTQGSINYFGIILNEMPASADLLELGSMLQSMDKLLFVGSSSSADIAGLFTTIESDGYTHVRCTYYSVSAAKALDFAAGYASRGLSIDFSGSNTAHTMELKEISGIDADPGMTQTLATAARAAGVDVYVDYGVPKTFTSGANNFFDQIYTNLAFKLKIQIAGFNYLAQTNTKIPQTEQGMSGLKGAIRKVCAAFVNNGVFAPGTWNDSTTFGNPDDHIRNIKDTGFYIYSDSIAAQSQADRAARVAPKIYVAGKDSGAIHSASVTVYVEA
jgi:hypothetical protein